MRIEVVISFSAQQMLGGVVYWRIAENTLSVQRTNTKVAIVVFPITTWPFDLPIVTPNAYRVQQLNLIAHLIPCIRTRQTGYLHRAVLLLYFKVCCFPPSRSWQKGKKHRSGRMMSPPLGSCHSFHTVSWS